MSHPQSQVPTWSIKPLALCWFRKRDHHWDLPWFCCKFVVQRICNPSLFRRKICGCNLGTFIFFGVQNARFHSWLKSFANSTLGWKSKLALAPTCKWNSVFPMKLSNDSWDIRPGWFWLWSTSSWLTKSTYPPPQCTPPLEIANLMIRAYENHLLSLNQGRLINNPHFWWGYLRWGFGWFAITKTHFDGHMNPPPTCLQPPPLLTCTVFSFEP